MKRKPTEAQRRLLDDACGDCTIGYDRFGRVRCFRYHRTTGVVRIDPRVFWNCIEKGWLRFRSPCPPKCDIGAAYITPAGRAALEGSE